jgi:hypothetical protein
MNYEGCGGMTRGDENCMQSCNRKTESEENKGVLRLL